MPISFRCRPLVLLAILTGAVGCAATPPAPYATPLTITGAAVGANGNAIVFALKNHYDAKGESTSEGTVSVFGPGRGCRARRATPADQTVYPLWHDDDGAVVRRLSGNTRLGFSRVRQDGSLTEAVSGSLPRTIGESAPLFLFLDGEVFERRPMSDQFIERPFLAAFSVGAHPIGADRTGGTYWVFPTGADGLGGQSLRPADTAAPERHFVADVRALGADGAPRFSVAVTTSTTAPFAYAVVPSGGLVVIDREQHMKRYLEDGALAYDILVASGPHRIETATDGAVVVGSSEGLVRFSKEGTEVWRQSFDGRLANGIRPDDDGRTWLLGIQEAGERRDVVRTELDASGAVVGTDVCPGL